VFKEPTKFQLCIENAVLKSEEYNLRLISCLIKNFKPFLLDLLCIVRHNLALRILDGSSSLLYTWRATLLSFFNALLRDLRMLSLQILFSMAKSVPRASENHIHGSTDGHERTKLLSMSFTWTSNGPRTQHQGLRSHTIHISLQLCRIQFK